ncbi:MAG: hypothetical protein OSB43_19225 [Nocardioides sp.]|uniref:hypothetical protein n=1 Tax=Nocardioides sp. TaxID=35761 RepID=UPI00239D9F31|nr:hypothetical protein [Nocardioides sp.]MDE0778418.1 hypothetical protein [Nocardioides sp.]
MATSTPAPATPASTPATTHATGSARSRGATTRRTRVVVPGRKALACAALLVVLGSFMPWVDTALGAVSGIVGAGLWTFYAAWVGIAGAIISGTGRLRIAAGHALVFGAIALGLVTWQVVHVLQLIGVGGWQPGVGLVFVVGGGVLACVAGVRMLRVSAA